MCLTHFFLLQIYVNLKGDGKIYAQIDEIVDNFF